MISSLISCLVVVVVVVDVFVVTFGLSTTERDKEVRDEDVVPVVLLVVVLPMLRREDDAAGLASVDDGGNLFARSGVLETSDSRPLTEEDIDTLEDVVDASLSTFN